MAQTRPRAPELSGSRRRRVGLVLSGGGPRATGFDAGVFTPPMLWMSPTVRRAPQPDVKYDIRFGGSSASGMTDAGDIEMWAGHAEDAILEAAASGTTSSTVTRRRASSGGPRAHPPSYFLTFVVVAFRTWP
jgi:hypothetical protein